MIQVIRLQAKYFIRWGGGGACTGVSPYSEAPYRRVTVWTPLMKPHCMGAILYRSLAPALRLLKAFPIMYCHIICYSLCNHQVFPAHRKIFINSLTSWPLSLSLEVAQTSVHTLPYLENNDKCNFDGLHTSDKRSLLIAIKFKAMSLSLFSSNVFILHFIVIPESSSSTLCNTDTYSKITSSNVQFL